MCVMFTSTEAGIDLRVAAYAVITDHQGRMLLPRWSERDHSGWTMPGGGIDPGEHPAEAAVREVLEETGYHVELDRVLGVDSFVIPGTDRVHPSERSMQALRIVYRAHITGGEVDLSRRWAGLIG